MREPRNCPLPEGWEARPYDFEAMFDMIDMTALRYDSTHPYPSAWMDIPILGFGFTLTSGDMKSQIANPNHAEDTLFESLALLIAGGRKSETIETCINLWMSLQGHWEHTDETIDAYQEIVLVQTFASRNEDYVTAIKNQT